MGDTTNNNYGSGTLNAHQGKGHMYVIKRLNVYYGHEQAQAIDTQLLLPVDGDGVPDLNYRGIEVALERLVGTNLIPSTSNCAVEESDTTREATTDEFTTGNVNTKFGNKSAQLSDGTFTSQLRAFVRLCARLASLCHDQLASGMIAGLTKAFVRQPKRLVSSLQSDLRFLSTKSFWDLWVNEHLLVTALGLQMQIPLYGWCDPDSFHIYICAELQRTQYADNLYMATVLEQKRYQILNGGANGQLLSLQSWQRDLDILVKIKSTVTFAIFIGELAEKCEECGEEVAAHANNQGTPAYMLQRLSKRPC